MASGFDLPKDKELAKTVLEGSNEIKRLKAERGWVGGLWGNNTHVAGNIAGIVVVTLLLAGAVFTACHNSGTVGALSIAQFWAIISPLITLALGYLFGDMASQKRSR